MNIGALLMALLAGALLPVQAAANKEIGRELGHSLHGSFVSFLVGTLGLAVVMLAMRLSPNVDRIVNTPWWAWIGGLLGAFFVTTTVVLAPKMGTAAFFATMVCGQMAASLLLDSTGFMHMPQIDITWGRAIGVLLVMVGVVIAARG